MPRTDQFLIDAMDCPTEEQMIRNRFRNVPEVESLAFDLMNRRLTVAHSYADGAPIRAALRDPGHSPSWRCPGMHRGRGAASAA